MDLPKKLSGEKVLESWSILIENENGKGRQLYEDFMNFLKESNVPELNIETVKVVPGG